MSASKISRLIKVLNKDKLIELKVGADKREKYLYLTAIGKKEIEKIDKFSVSKIENAFRFLNDAEMLNIIESIDKYSGALEKIRSSYVSNHQKTNCQHDYGDTEV